MYHVDGRGYGPVSHNLLVMRIILIWTRRRAKCQPHVYPQLPLSTVAIIFITFIRIVIYIWACVPESHRKDW